MEMKDFVRKLKLQAFFQDKPSIQGTTDTGLRPKSTFTPPDSTMPIEILTFEKAIMTEVNKINLSKAKVFHNTNKQEQQAIRELAGNNEIIIKPADKGGAIVLQTRESYDTECLRLLSDRRNYTVLHDNPTERLRTRIGSMIEEGLAHDWLSKHEAEFLQQPTPSVPYFYCIPKIHKSMSNPPGRPIVSGIGSILEPLSKFADAFLHPLVQSTTTYLKDTKSVLQLIDNRDFDPSSQLLMSLDVESLYTSLPHDETLQIIEEVLFTTPWKYQTPRGLVLECISLALQQNFFQYKQTIYLQSHGTSMGSTFAPSLAGLYVHHLETNKILHPGNPYRNNINTWKRYIDDVFVIWNGDHQSAVDFLVWLNNQNAFLKFTSTISAHSMVFLDLNVYTEKGKLKSKTHFKPTARNCLLRYDSFHPRHLRENLPYGQFL
ncbi:uncharacterized protein LOC144785472 [Lissotriton helveticus]